MKNVEFPHSSFFAADVTRLSTIRKTQYDSKNILRLKNISKNVLRQKLPHFKFYALFACQTQKIHTLRQCADVY